MLPPLDAPHHLRKHEWGPYREGTLNSLFGKFQYVDDFILLMKLPYLINICFVEFLGVTVREGAPNSTGTLVDVGLHKVV